jgi:two-component system, OmpR family, sensor kinase
MGDDATPPLGHDDATAAPERDALARAELRLRTLQRLLGIGGTGLRAAVDEAATLLAEAFGADKVDVFLYRPERDTLAAAGTSDTPMGRKQQALGLDRLPLSSGGLCARVFRTGEPYRTGHADMDPEELRAVVEELGVRSELLMPLGGAAGRGVLAVV